MSVTVLKRATIKHSGTKYHFLKFLKIKQKKTVWGLAKRLKEETNFTQKSIALFTDTQ